MRRWNLNWLHDIAPSCEFFCKVMTGKAPVHCKSTPSVKPGRGRRLCDSKGGGYTKLTAKSVPGTPICACACVCSHVTFKVHVAATLPGGRVCASAREQGRHGRQPGS